MKRENWVWMPHAGHFIGSSKCRFHLNTYVGKYIVSTVGEYWPDSQVRKIHAQVAGVEIKGIGDEWDHNYFKKFGFEEIGLGRKYETMVFAAGKSKDECCPYVIDVSKQVDADSYNDPEDARKGHMKLCGKWSKK